MAKNNTTFDNVFRTMLEKMPELIVPVLNEIFGTNYPLDVPLEQLRNEHQTLNGEKITDSYFRIGKKGYHFECQSTGDSKMVIRMVEYDFAISIENVKKEKWNFQNEISTLSGDISSWYKKKETQNGTDHAGRKNCAVSGSGFMCAEVYER